MAGSFATDQEKLAFLLRVYFGTQAAIEADKGREGLPAWTERSAAANAAEVKRTIPDPRGQTLRLLGGLHMMLQVYPGSEAVLSEEDGEVRLDVRRCGIYDYREQAQRGGVTLTLPTPCEFCTDLHRREAGHLGIELTNQLGERSCVYVARIPGEASDGG
jgi:hypothetical protein